MKTLNLKLIKQWFDMVRLRIKPEEYREITGYWAARLFEQNYPFEENPNLSIFWEDVAHDLLRHPIEEVMRGYYLKFKDFDIVKFDNGYHPNSPTFNIEFQGVDCREGKPEWGAIPGKKYFVINLGEIK